MVGGGDVVGVLVVGVAVTGVCVSVVGVCAAGVEDGALVVVVTLEVVLVERWTVVVVEAGTDEGGDVDGLTELPRVLTDDELPISATNHVPSTP